MSSALGLSKLLIVLDVEVMTVNVASELPRMPSMVSADELDWSGSLRKGTGRETLIRSALT